MTLPFILEATDLEEQLQRPDLVIIDLCKIDNYAEKHIPGALWLDYGKIVRMQRPVMGLLPELDQLGALFSSLGITNKSHVVAYDDEGGGKAARLLWTLDVIGHKNQSLLNGGIYAWVNEGHPTTRDLPNIESTHYKMPKAFNDMLIADQHYILEHLNDSNCKLLDARSSMEYHGQKAFAQKAGRIPGAIHFEWSEAIDMDNNLRLKDLEQLEITLKERGFNKNNVIVAYCQTHHRSAYSCIMLKALGYKNVRGYPGSWSDWGNSPDTPVKI